MSVAAWQARLYPEVIHRDPVAQFVRALDRYVQPSHDVLDLGAGAGEQSVYRLKGRVRRIVGVDLDPRVVDNPLLDEGRVADITALPFPDNSFDLAFAIYVLEHLPEPAKLVSELRRVLRPGGVFLALTPNRYHYVSLISALTPTSFHKWFNKRRGRNEEDTFPTCYRLNSRRAVRRYFEPQFQTEELTMIEVQPNYLKFSTPTYLMGAAYERLVNATPWLAGLRVNIIMALRNGSKAE